jgi:hypothetical protein
MPSWYRCRYAGVRLHGPVLRDGRRGRPRRRQVYGPARGAVGSQHSPGRRVRDMGEAVEEP